MKAVRRVNGVRIGGWKDGRFIPNGEFDPERDDHLIKESDENGTDTRVPEEREDGEADG